MKTVGSLQELKEKLRNNQELFLLIYKQGSEQSNLAYANLSKANDPQNGSVYTCNVNEVHDIHGNYGISSAPSFLRFQNGQLKQVVKGAQTPANYKSLLQGVIAQQTNDQQQKATKSVIVYTTPTCSWCNTLKGYLRENRIQFREIDVTKDEKMATKMVQKSGQQGVPQTEINGEMIVGFDRNRINQLLEINK
ncbi:MAG TPA: glutaredoxin domain-containing protein [Sunxiuqinia sp.]|nr:glutaredoxin domain-containing protein [Sunxiuqinia sp.]